MVMRKMDYYHRLQLYYRELYNKRGCLTDLLGSLFFVFSIHHPTILTHRDKFPDTSGQVPPVR